MFKCLNWTLVGIVDDEIDITETFQAAICGSIEGISVFTFNDPVLALEHFTTNMTELCTYYFRFKNAWP